MTETPADDERRSEVADERDRIADERDRAGAGRAEQSESREAVADAIEAALRAVAGTGLAPAVLDDLSANAADRGHNAAAQAARQGQAAAGPPGGRPGMDPDRRDFLADDREDQADRLESLQDQGERLADQREAQLRSLAAEVGLDAAARASGEPIAWPSSSDPVVRARDMADRTEAGAARRAATRARDAAHRSLLAEQLVGIAQALVRSRSVDAVLADVVQAAHQVVAGCDSASFTAVRDGVLVTIGATDETARLIDELQYRAGEGPAIEAVATMAIVQTKDLATESRWPGFRRNLEATPVCGLFSVGVANELRGTTLGCLNLYTHRPGGFQAEDEEAAMLLAAHLGAVLALAARADDADARVGQLSEALDSRDVIGQAKGILMERKRLTADQAFDVLVRASQALNRKLRDVADDFTSTGALDSRD
ncbi:MAG: GAF and ANTAR domain-containing protein [Actinobacteria bacterium]|nr:GAF and ANTAR domain-containing protein [Actinomycetota bacterium]